MLRSGLDLVFGMTFINNQEDYKIESPWYQEHKGLYPVYAETLRSWIIKDE